MTRESKTDRLTEGLFPQHQEPDANHRTFTEMMDKTQNSANFGEKINIFIYFLNFGVFSDDISGAVYRALIFRIILVARCTGNCFSSTAR
jgi:hypothetical protein